LIKIAIPVLYISSGKASSPPKRTRSSPGQTLFLTYFVGSGILSSYPIRVGNTALRNLKSYANEKNSFNFINLAQDGNRSIAPTVLRIRDVYPGSRILIFIHPGSRISDPGSRIQKQQQKTGMKIFFFQTIFCSHKFHKTKHYFIFDMLKKKIWPNFPRIIEVFTQKIVTKPSKIWVWDPGSGIRDPGSEKKPIPDPGSRGQKGTGSRIRIRNTALQEPTCGQGFDSPPPVSQSPTRRMSSEPQYPAPHPASSSPP
jgi:hypothetical protein